MSRRHHASEDHPIPPPTNTIFEIDFTQGLDENFGASHIVNTDVYATPTIDAVKGLLTYGRKSNSSQSHNGGHVTYTLTSAQLQSFQNAKKIVSTITVQPIAYNSSVQGMVVVWAGNSINVNTNSYQPCNIRLSNSNLYLYSPIGEQNTIQYMYEEYENGSGIAVATSNYDEQTWSIANMATNTRYQSAKSASSIHIGVGYDTYYGNTDIWIKSVKIECYE